MLALPCQTIEKREVWLAFKMKEFRLRG